MRFERQQWLWLAVPFAGLLAVAIALSLFESHLLYRVQLQSLFLNTPLFFRQCMVSSGGLLSWAGAWFTQFFYHPVLGASLLCLLWALLVVLLMAAFRIPARWAVITLIPVSMLLLSNVTLGYWIFYLKLRGCFFVATLGTLVAVSLLWCFRLLSSRRILSILFIPLSVACCYPLAGFYALLAAMLIAVISWRIEGFSWRHAILCDILAVASVIAVPQICYEWLYHETPLEGVYLTALPSFFVQGKPYPTYYIPYVVLALSLVLMAASFRRLPEEERRPLHRRLFWITQTLLPCILVIVTVFFWYKDDNFHRELRMSRAVSQHDWQQVLTISAESGSEPTRAICLMRHLALFRLGRLGSEMYRYPRGSARPSAPFPVRIVQTEGKMLYMNYGITNFCVRWCIEDGVEYGWSVSILQHLIKCSLLNGEYDAARKYISILKKTRFHRQWCTRYESYVRNPRLMADDQELFPILPLLAADTDYLTSDNADIEQFLLNHFVSTDSRNPVYQELALSAAMQLKNSRLFWPQFYQYTSLHPDSPVPLHYQEAACLFGRLSHEVDTSRMPFDAEVVHRCDEFLAARDQHRGRDYLQEHFGDTYFFDYFYNASAQ